MYLYGNGQRYCIHIHLIIECLFLDVVSPKKHQAIQTIYVFTGIKMNVADFQCKHIKRNENIIPGKSTLIPPNKHVTKTF